MQFSNCLPETSFLTNLHTYFSTMPVDTLRTVKDYTTPYLLRQALVESAECEDCECGSTTAGGKEAGRDWVQKNIDANTSIPFDVEQEAERLMVLKSYGILDTDNQDPAFAEITELAQKKISLSNCHDHTCGSWQTLVEECSRCAWCCASAQARWLVRSCGPTKRRVWSPSGWRYTQR
jgi:hypothetical protein